MNVLIIGGAGFIGINAAEYHIKKKNSVTIFDNFSRKGSRSNAAWLEKEYPKKATIIEGDIRTDTKKLTQLVKKVDLVLHLAGQVAVTSSVLNPREDFEINALGTFNVL